MKRRDTSPELKRLRQNHTRALNRLHAANEASAALKYKDPVAEAALDRAIELYKQARNALIDEEN